MSSQACLTAALSLSPSTTAPASDLWVIDAATPLTTTGYPMLSAILAASKEVFANPSFGDFIP